MHPAKSVIFFTTTTGAGYGLMIWLSVLALFGLVPFELGFGLIAFALSLGLITIGLLSSALHLGHPERAWRAFSQWRSSWLSREGVASVLAFAPMGLFALAWTFLDAPAWMPLMAVGAAVMALITVFTTSMIYGSLKSIPAWHSVWTPPGYLLFSLGTGGVLAALLTAFWKYDVSPHLAMLAAFFLILALIVKFFHWSSIDTGEAVSTAGSATGLGKFGNIKLVEGPHTEDNYLMQEMGFSIARKHASKLRRIVVTGFVMAILICLITGLFLPEGARFIALIFATLFAAFAVFTERWLYFAQARHVVTLYYGQNSA